MERQGRERGDGGEEGGRKDAESCSTRRECGDGKGREGLKQKQMRKSKGEEEGSAPQMVCWGFDPQSE